MREVILAKFGEIVLKGLNKKNFEDTLIRNIKTRLSSIGSYNIRFAQSTMIIEANENSDLCNVIPIIEKTFGIATFSRACVAEKSMEDIESKTAEYFCDTLNECYTFKIEAKRSDKKFELNSPKISEVLGGYLLDRFKHLKVDVHNPDIIITVEIRDFGAYIRGNSEKGAGGIPVGTGGKAAIMISGGIDSPVAAWMMAKRGVSLTAIHFASPPYTSERAEQKVIDLLSKVSEYSGYIKMFTVPFTEIQETIKKKCPEELFTIIMRRIMMRISEIIAKQENCDAIITGESLGQVASQTIQAINCTNNVVSMPVFRPLIGMDKDEIVQIARRIDTFNLSIQPYEDCCTVFVPKHPRTRPKIKLVELAETSIEWEPLIENSIKNCRIINIAEYGGKIIEKTV